MGHQQQFGRDSIMLGQSFSDNTKVPISCFLEDIDRLRELKKKSLNVSRSFPDACPFRLAVGSGYEMALLG
jgi:hypothetical protein